MTVRSQERADVAALDRAVKALRMPKEELAIRDAALQELAPGERLLIASCNVVRLMYLARRAVRLRPDIKVVTNLMECPDSDNYHFQEEAG